MIPWWTCLQPTQLTGPLLHHPHHQSPSPGSNSGTLTAPNSESSSSGSESGATPVSQPPSGGGNNDHVSATSTHQQQHPQSGKRPHEEQERVQAIQKLQFHDFPLTTATLSRGSSAAPTITQAKILADRQLDLLRLQVSLKIMCCVKFSPLFSQMFLGFYY